MPEDSPTEPRFEPDDSDSDTGREDSTMIAARSKVWFYDDDQTPIDFVLFVLEEYFGHEEPAARKIIDQIRADGRAIAAELQAVPAELAKRRVDQAAADAGYPFKVEVEEQRIV